LSSIEPQHVSDELLAVWTASGGRCLPHFHLPLQSGDDGVLRRMGRRYVSAEYAATVARVREAVPGVAIHADVIAGFPGEDDAAFANTIAFIRAIEPAGLHVFRYSGRPGTPAVRMIGQVDEPVRRRRSSVLLALAAERRAAFARALVGRRLDVLFESRLDDGRWIGHAAEYVEVVAGPREQGSLENVRAEVECTSADPEAPDRLAGSIVALRAASRTRGSLPVLPGVPSPPMSRSEGEHHAA
jgi:threonylcarbamoyladenosine tRNA methylthiotransferase MtaB